MQTLKRLGVRSIINLRLTNDVWRPEAAQARALGMAYTNVPMHGMRRPTDESIRRILTLIRTLPGPVFVHCQRGADRTGTVIACYRIQHDHWSSDQAQREADHYGMSKLERDLRKYIVDFANNPRGP
jgi:protein tyrosine/serine phosphatase